MCISSRFEFVSHYDIGLSDLVNLPRTCHAPVKGRHCQEGSSGKWAISTQSFVPSSVLLVNISLGDFEFSRQVESETSHFLYCINPSTAFCPRLLAIWKRLLRFVYHGKRF
jgi:hypothetical protein